MMCAYYTNIASSARGNISKTHPTGWKQVFVKKNGKSYALYNRSHILMFKMLGLNDNKNNLITGTEYFNQTLMLDVESQVCDYVRSSKEHVIYRVTPVFSGNELITRGVLMEAESVELDGLKLCRYVPNIEPGVSINYTTGAASSTSSSVSVS
jgi:DNA-entry nuclease